MHFVKTILKVTVLVGLQICSAYCSESNKTAVTSPANWTYIQVDSNRAKWGDFDQAKKWMKYFGLSASDATGNGYKDIVSGRYFYRNPGGDMTAKWQRVDFGFNVDGMLFVDVDSDRYSDVIAEALPDVYWLEARDKDGSSWEATKICTLPKTGHVNGQGYTLAQIIPGGKPEILLSTGDGIYCLQIPRNPAGGNWPKTRIARQASEEGIGTGDINGDGDIDIAAGYGEKARDKGMSVAWWQNPGNGTGDWKLHHVGTTIRLVDRVAIADLNADGRADIIVTEERWPEPEDAHVYWYQQGGEPKSQSWLRHTIAGQNTTNNLDIADMDGDGDTDLITAEHRGTKKMQIWENDGKGNFTEYVVDKGKESHLGAQVFDMDNDGDLDIISIAWDSYRYLHLWRNDAKPAYRDSGTIFPKSNLKVSRRLKDMTEEPMKVKLETTMGNIVVELNAKAAPITVKNFLGYVEKGFYDGVIFHRVMPNFMIQAGGFTTDMARKATNKPIVNEAKNGLKNARGTIAMARTSNPNSATSQFFINHKDNDFLNYVDSRRPGYTVFGKVIEGMEVVDAIAAVKTTRRNGMADVPAEPVVIKSAKVPGKK